MIWRAKWIANLLGSFAVVVSFGWPETRAVAAEQTCRTVEADLAMRARPEDLKRQSTFAMRLLLASVQDGAKNAAISPFGVETILSELELAANSRMKSAIRSTLQTESGDPGAMARIRRNARLLAQIEGNSFTSADAIFVGQMTSLKPGMRDLLEAEGRVLVKSVDFGSATDVSSINKWASDNTAGRIDNILEPDPSLSIAAINALYFKDCWRTPFDPATTQPRRFTTLGGAQDDRPAMRADLDDIPHARQGRFTALELPYADGRFALTIITTNDRPASPSAFEKAVRLLWEPVLRPRNVRLYLPQFSATNDIDLLAPLSKLGLRKGLASPGNLDKLASGISLSMLRQKTFVALDEQGTEAAAVTIAGATRSVEVADSRLSVSFDKPFIYALRHRATGAVLMFGYVADPGQKS